MIRFLLSSLIFLLFSPCIFADLTLPDSLSSCKGFTIFNSAAGLSNKFGYFVDGGMDINGDEIPDIIVLDYQYPKTSTLYVIYGIQASYSDFDVATMTSKQGFKITGLALENIDNKDFFNSGKDIDGDGVADLVIAATADENSQGNVYVIYGKKGGYSDFDISDWTPQMGFKMNETAKTAKTKTDINGEVSADLLNGANFNDEHGQKGGQSDLSTLGMTASQGHAISGDSTSDIFGSSLVSIDDVSGDGISDYIIGAKDYDLNKGAAYVIYGQKDPPSQIDLTALASSGHSFTIFGGTPGGFLGFSIKNIGDLNRDGVSDIIFGEPGANRAYVLFGSNAWGCKTCRTSLACETCNFGYEYQANGLCYPVNSPKKQGSQQRFLAESDSVNPSLKKAVYGGSIIAYIINRVLNIWLPTHALPYIYGQLRTSLFYIRYMEISRTQKLEEVFQLYDDSEVNILPSVGLRDSWKNSFPTLPLPAVFEHYDLPSTFIGNFGDSLLCLLIILIVFLIIRVLYIIVQKYYKEFSTLRSALEKFSVILQNFFIGSFAQSLGPIVFSALLEFRNSSKGEIYYAISPAACYISLVFGFFLMTFHIYLLLKLKTFRKKQPEESKFLCKRYNGVAVLYDDYRDNSFANQLVFLLFNFRAIIEALIIGTLYGSPQAQAAVLLVHNLVVLIYLIFKRPFKSKIDLIHQICLVVSVLICSASVAPVAGSNKQNTTSNDYEDITEITSGIIYIVMILFQFVPLPFFLAKLAHYFWESKKIKPSPNHQEISQNHSSAEPEMSPEQPTAITTQAHLFTDRVSLIEQDLENPIEKSSVIVEEEPEEVDLEVSGPSLAERTRGLEQSKRRRLLKQGVNIWESNDEPDEAKEEFVTAEETKEETLKKEDLPVIPKEPEAVENEVYGVDSAVKNLTKPKAKQPRKARWMKPMHQQLMDSLYNIDDLYHRPKNETQDESEEVISPVGNPELEAELGPGFVDMKADEEINGEKDLEIEEQVKSVEEVLEGKEEDKSEENEAESLEIKEEFELEGVEKEDKSDGIKGLVDDDEQEIFEREKELAKERQKEREKEEKEKLEDIALDLGLKEAEDLVKEIEKELKKEKKENLVEEKEPVSEVLLFEKVYGEKAKTEEKSKGDEFDDLIKAFLDQDFSVIN